MSTIEQCFALLRCGLWGGTANPSDFPESTDWKAIYRFAKQQTVEAILYDGLSTLPSHLYPESSLLRQWYTYVVKIEQSHKLVNQRLTEVVAHLQTEGIQPVLLKGQGIAQNYLTPNHRHCGDIDLYIGKKEHKRCCKVIGNWDIGPTDFSQNKKHHSFMFKGVNIELHRIAQHLENPLSNRRFQDWTERHLSAGNIRKWEIDGVELWLPPANFDALYIFSHLYRHFFQGGIGLRQFCDWVRYLHRFRHSINRQVLERDLTDFGLARVWRLFGPIAVEYLGLPEEEMPLYIPAYSKSAETIVGYILKDGNFGSFSRMSPRPKGYLKKKLYSLRHIQKRTWQLFPLFPKEVISNSTAHVIDRIVQLIKFR